MNENIKKYSIGNNHIGWWCCKETENIFGQYLSKDGTYSNRCITAKESKNYSYFKSYRELMRVFHRINNNTKYKIEMSFTQNQHGKNYMYK
jgi:hypothetical protein